MKKTTTWNLGIGKGGGYSSTIRRDIQDTTSKHRTTNWISGGGYWNYIDGDTSQNYIATSGYKTIGCYTCWDYKDYRRGDKCLKCCKIHWLHFYHFPRILGMKSKV